MPHTVEAPTTHHALHITHPACITMRGWTAGSTHHSPRPGCCTSGPSSPAAHCKAHQLQGCTQSVPCSIASHPSTRGCSGRYHEHREPKRWSDRCIWEPARCYSTLIGWAAAAAGRWPRCRMRLLSQRQKQWHVCRPMAARCRAAPSMHLSGAWPRGAACHQSGGSGAR